MSERASQSVVPFRVRKLGHIVLNVADLERSVRFYTEVLGFSATDRYPDELMPGRMVFLRLSPDHHNLALVGGAKEGERTSLNHFAIEVGTLEEVFQARDWLRQQGVQIHFEGRRRAGCQIAVEFKDPDGNHVEIYWGMDQLGPGQVGRPWSEWREAHTLEEAVANPVEGQSVSPPAGKGYSPLPWSERGRG